MANILGNTVNSVNENARAALVTVGKAALHSLAPDNIEYYFCTLELIDSMGFTKGFMSFAIMPNNIMESKTQIATITKTNTGIVSLFNDSFNPRDISIQGTFGRKFRLLSGMKEVSEDVSSVKFFGGNTGYQFNEDNQILIKSGYGLTKMLKSICDASWKKDENGQPHILVFSNYALNTSYIVEVLQDSYSQSTENNMLWYYSLEMKAVAPYSALNRNKKSDTEKFLITVATGAIAKGLNNVIWDVINYTGQALRKPL